jgi:hypothetical protein
MYYLDPKRDMYVRRSQRRMRKEESNIICKTSNFRFLNGRQARKRNSCLNSSKCNVSHAISKWPRIALPGLRWSLVYDVNVWCQRQLQTDRQTGPSTALIFLLPWCRRVEAAAEAAAAHYHITQQDKGKRWEKQPLRAIKGGKRGRCAIFTTRPFDD